MRQIPYLNSENRQLIDITLHIVTGFFPAMGSFLSFIGAILYLKKSGVALYDSLYGTIANRSTELDELLSGDFLHDIILSVLNDASNFINEVDIRGLLLQFDSGEFHESEYLYWYDYAIESSGRYNKQVLSVVPEGLVELVQAFVCPDTKRLFVPFGGIMNFATELRNFDSIEAWEVNYQTWQIGMLRMGLAGVDAKVRFSNKNIDFWPTKSYDAIVSMPPFAARMKMVTPPSHFEANSAELSELIAPCRFLETTNEDGVCVAFAPVSLLDGGFVKKNFRKWAIDHKIIDTVILLPGNLLNVTSIPLACVIMRKKTYHTGAVRMIDASGLYSVFQNRKQLEVGLLMDAYHSDVKNVSRTVSYEEIQDLDYSWNVKEYFKEKMICPEGFSISLLEDLVSLPHLESSTSRDKGLIVKVSDLSDDWAHPYIHKEKLVEGNVMRGYSRLDRDAVLVSTMRSLKPSIIKASEETPVWINPNIMAIVPNEAIDAEYLCSRLSELKIQTISVGVPHISKSYLLRQKIAYPELSVQKNLYAEGVRTLALAKAEDLGLQDVVDQMKADYINEVRSRKHDMKTPMTQLRNTLTLIKELVGELPKEYACKLETYVNRQQRAMDVLSDIVSHIADEDVFAAPEIVDIEAVLKSFETVTDKYVVEYHRDNASLEEAGIETPYLKIGKVDFVRLSQNIVSNAIKRGFVKNYPEYALNITLSVEKEFFVISFSNNGEPLPEGMDKVRYGTKGVKGTNSDGSGTGGYIVKSIVKHYGGDYDIFSSKFANMYFTNVIVKLPIYRKEDE